MVCNFAENNNAMKKILLPTVIASLGCIAMQGHTDNAFNWGNATVYFVITDRFCNGDSTNDINYGRKIDYGSEQLNAATFHGGDSRGCCKKPVKDISEILEWMWYG